MTILKWRTNVGSSDMTYRKGQLGYPNSTIRNSLSLGLFRIMKENVLYARTREGCLCHYPLRHPTFVQHCRKAS
jgi:hypothetical protein